jgi:hypothetical protein
MTEARRLATIMALDVGVMACLEKYSFAFMSVTRWLR